MTPAPTGERSPSVGLAVRLAVANALNPGELDRQLEAAGDWINSTLAVYCGAWVARLGWDTAHAEALFGAMKGLVSWIIGGGPDGPYPPSVYIRKGILYHFGNRFPRHVGPVRINPRVYRADPARALTQLELDDTDGGPTDGAEVFGVGDGGPAAVDAAEAFAKLGATVLEVADGADPSGLFRAVIDLRHGITSGRPLSFTGVGASLLPPLTKQGAHAAYTRALAAVRRSPCLSDPR